MLLRMRHCYIGENVQTNCPKLARNLTLFFFGSDAPFGSEAPMIFSHFIVFYRFVFLLSECKIEHMTHIFLSQRSLCSILVFSTLSRD